MDRQVATAIRDVPHLMAFLDITEAFLQEIDLSPLLVYVIDTTSAEALPYLAKQLDVLGYKGWALATTEQEQRELLKKAIELHRYKGTPWSIKEALKSVGFGGAEIVEGISDVSRTGIYFRNGTIFYNTPTLYDWALFSIVVDLGETKGVTAEQTELAVKLIDEYKNVRSKLVGITFKVTISETQTINDNALVYQRELSPDSETINGLIRDGRGRYDGQYMHKGNGDKATLQVRNSFGVITQTYEF